MKHDIQICYVNRANNDDYTQGGQMREDTKQIRDILSDEWIEEMFGGDI